MDTVKSTFLDLDLHEALLWALSLCTMGVRKSHRLSSMHIKATQGRCRGGILMDLGRNQRIQWSHTSSSGEIGQAKWPRCSDKQDNLNGVVASSNDSKEPENKKKDSHNQTKQGTELGNEKKVKQCFLGVSLPFVSSGSFTQVEFSNHIAWAHINRGFAFQMLIAALIWILRFGLYPLILSKEAIFRWKKDNKIRQGFWILVTSCALQERP